MVYGLGDQLLFAFDAVNNVSAEVFEGALALSSVVIVAVAVTVTVTSEI